MDVVWKSGGAEVGTPHISRGGSKIRIQTSGLQTEGLPEVDRGLKGAATRRAFGFLVGCPLQRPWSDRWSHVFFPVWNFGRGFEEVLRTR